MRRKWFLGFGLILLSIFYIFLMLNDIRWFFGLLAPLIILGIYDYFQTKHSILRNFPVLGHIRFILEFIRPEIRQYFISDDENERPFSRELRTVVYERAKNISDTTPFGTQLNTKAFGYTWIMHSIKPIPGKNVDTRILIGEKNCKQPYSASHLNISAMSYGAISPNAIMALNLGAKMGDFYHNTGEGGISDYHLKGGDLVFQVGTGYFGCRDKDGLFSPQEFEIEANRPEVKMIEIKLSQGAKPGHGGILPAAKLTPEIARVRKVPMGHDVMSPIYHSAFSTPIELLEFIQKLRDLSNGKPVGFKLCIGLRREFLGICKAMIETGIKPDFITVDGGEGGTGAAPLEFTNYIGEPLDDALRFVHNALVGSGLRGDIKVICSGKIITGFDMVYHLALGADLFNCARGMMMSVGCIQSRQCHLNTCPTGVATQNPRLQRGLVVDEKKLRAYHFHKNTLESFYEIIGAMGLNNPNEITLRHLMRRVSIEKCLSLYDIYEPIESGVFLTKKIPESFKYLWEVANAKYF